MNIEDPCPPFLSSCCFLVCFSRCVKAVTKQGLPLRKAGLSGIGFHPSAAMRNGVAVIFVVGIH